LPRSNILGLPSRLIEDTSRYEIETFLENDKVGADWGLVHTPTEW
jgi:hypothetical protein